MHDQNDALILEGIKSKSEESIRILYKDFFPMVLDHIKQHSGTSEDAEDVFQDAMVALYLRVTSGRSIVLDCTLRTYFFAICRNIWKQRFERKRRLVLVDPNEVHERNHSYNIREQDCREDEMERQRLFHMHFLSLAEDCQKLLFLFFNKIPLRQIAAEMGFKGESYAKTRKYMCKNMLRKKIMNDPACKTFFNHVRM